MRYSIVSSKDFKKQFDKLDEKSCRIIHDKIQLIKENPFRYKKLKGRKFSNLFRVRLNLNKKETRLIYAILSPEIIIICLLDRKKDYKDLKKYLSKIKK